MDKCCSYYKVDRHFADCALEPYRYCEDQWIWITGDLRYNANGCVELAKRVVAAVLLVIPTLVAFLISLVAVGLKAYYELDVFTDREAILFAEARPDWRGIHTLGCNLHLGVIQGIGDGGKYYFCTPRMDEFQQCEDLLDEGMLSITQNTPSEVATETRRDFIKKLAERRIVPGQNFCFVKCAPILGIILVHRSQEPILYSTPDMAGFEPIPKRGVAPATGGFINESGHVIGERLVDFNG